MKAGESMRRNFAQILKDAKIDIKVEYQKLYGMLYDRSKGRCRYRASSIM